MNKTVKKNLMTGGSSLAVLSVVVGLAGVVFLGSNLSKKEVLPITTEDANKVYDCACDTKGEFQYVINTRTRFNDEVVGLSCSRNYNGGYTVDSAAYDSKENSKQDIILLNRKYGRRDCFVGKKDVVLEESDVHEYCTNKCSEEHKKKVQDSKKKIKGRGILKNVYFYLNGKNKPQAI